MSPFDVKEKKGSEMEFGAELWRLSLGKAMEGSEHLTYLLFLKIADERTKPPYHEPSVVPAEYSWPTLMKKGDELFDHYRHVLEKLGNEK